MVASSGLLAKWKTAVPSASSNATPTASQANCVARVRRRVFGATLWFIRMVSDPTSDCAGRDA
jgi:hypothetical protein